jgi:hypothetical protein
VLGVAVLLVSALTGLCRVHGTAPYEPAPSGLAETRAWTMFPQGDSDRQRNSGGPRDER